MPSHLRRYDVPGHTHFWTISCTRRLMFFWHNALKRVVIDGLATLRQRRAVCIVGYAVMPEHVHVILYPHSRGSDKPLSISKLLHAYKKHVGFHGKQELRRILREDGKLWSRPLNAWASEHLDTQSIWNTRGYDFNIDRHDTLLQKLDYCHKNPITRGLVERAEDWPWSSFRFYEFDDRSVLPMDWDGRWPIEW